MTDEITLDDLYKSYQILTSKLSGIERAIIAFGGVIPSIEVSKPEKSKLLPLANIVGAPYPKSWEARIKYVIDHPMTGKDIRAAIEKQEPDTDKTTIANMVRQYTSAMLKDGVLEIDHKDGNKNYYKVKATV